MDKHDYDGYAELLANTGKDTTKCSWCCSPFHKLQSKGFCGHCYRINRESKRLNEQIKDLKAQNKHIPWDLHYEYQVSLKMEELAKQENWSFESADSFHTGMRIERLLDYVSEHWVNHSFYSQYASIFSNIFSSAQRRAVIYLLSKMVREHMRKNRRSTAVSRLADEEIYPLPPPAILSK
jgi:hypothetical protein